MRRLLAWEGDGGTEVGGPGQAIELGVDSVDLPCVGDLDGVKDVDALDGWTLADSGSPAEDDGIAGDG